MKRAFQVKPPSQKPVTVRALPEGDVISTVNSTSWAASGVTSCVARQMPCHRPHRGTGASWGDGGGGTARSKGTRQRRSLIGSPCRGAGPQVPSPPRGEGNVRHGSVGLARKNQSHGGG